MSQVYRIFETVQPVLCTRSELGTTGKLHTWVGRVVRPPRGAQAKERQNENFKRKKNDFWDQNFLIIETKGILTKRGLIVIFV